MNNKPLLILFVLFFLVAAFLMLFYIYNDPFIGHGDSANTAVVARNLAEGNGYTVDYVMHFFIDYPQISHPEDTWPLGLPTFTSIFFKIFESAPFVAKLPNILLFLSFVLIMFLFLLKKYNVFIAFFTSVFTLFNVTIFEWLKEPYNDVDFLIFVNLAMLFLSFWVIQQKNKYILFAGIFTAFSLLFKQTGLLLIPFFVIIIIIKIMNGETGSSEKASKRTIFLFLLVTLLIASPWFVRNLLLFGDPIFSIERNAGKLIGGGNLQDEPYKIAFNRSDIISLKQTTLYEKMVFNLKEWYYFGRTIIKGYIVPDVILFLSLFALVLLNFNKLEKSLVAVNVSFIIFYLLFIIFYWHVEGRYFLFAIPFLNFLAAKLLHSFYLQMLKPIHKVAFILMLIFLLFYVSFPFLSTIYLNFP